MSGFYNSLLNGSASNEEIIDEIARVGKQLDFLLSGNLGSKNIREVGDYLVGANDFVSRSGTVGISSLVTGADDLRFWAGSAARETAPFRVYESGDTHVANLLATGGTVTGATIQTSASGQRVVQDINGLRSYDANGYKRLSISPSTAREVGMAGFEVFDPIGAYGGVIFGVTGGKMWVLGENGLIISSWFGQTTIRDYVDFTGAIISGLDISDVTNLQSSLDAKATKNVSTSSTSVSDSHNHGLTSSDYIQCYDSAGVATSKKQWVPYAGSASHSHNQN